MARGAQDYSNVSAPGGLDRLDDLAELPPRLLFPSSLDRQGKVVLMDTFATGGNAVDAITAGLGEICRLSVKGARYGGFTYELTRVANVNSYAGLAARVAAVGGDRVGVEVAFVVEGHLPNLKLYLEWHEGATRYVWGLRWDVANEKVYIGYDGIGWEPVAGTYKLFLGTGTTHNMKVVGDIDDNAYVRAYIDGKRLSLPVKAVYVSNYVYTPTLGLLFYNGLDPVDAPRVYVDYIILTRAEP